jgi:hypothetical protein
VWVRSSRSTSPTRCGTTSSCRGERLLSVCCMQCCFGIYCAIFRCLVHNQPEYFVDHVRCGATSSCRGEWALIAVCFLICCWLGPTGLSIVVSMCCAVFCCLFNHQRGRGLHLSAGVRGCCLLCCFGVYCAILCCLVLTARVSGAASFRVGESHVGRSPS